MTAYIPAELRREALSRAGGRCEYCRLPEPFVVPGLEVDHVVSEQHGGPTVSDNLCAACPRCNRAKGPNVAAIDEETGEAVILFNPRLQDWEEHFHPEGALIVGRTPTGRATVRILAMNGPARIAERTLADLTSDPAE